MKKAIFTVVILVLAIAGLQAQTTTNSSGGQANGSGGKASYSVGQIAYSTHNGSNGIVAEGVQQVYEIAVPTGMELDKRINLSVLVYPNPSTDYLQLQVDASATLSIHELQYQLFNIQGKLLQTNKLSSSKTQINMSSYTSAIYLLRVVRKNQTIKEFKITKQ